MMLRGEGFPGKQTIPATSLPSLTRHLPASIVTGSWGLTCPHGSGAATLPSQGGPTLTHRQQPSPGLPRSAVSGPLHFAHPSERACCPAAHTRAHRYTDAHTHTYMGARTRVRSDACLAAGPRHPLMLLRGRRWLRGGPPVTLQRPPQLPGGLPTPSPGRQSRVHRSVQVPRLP